MNHMDIGSTYLDSIRSRFASVKDLGGRALAQVNDRDLVWRSNDETNSIAVIVQHLHGNMLSRWTDFLTSDGEKPDRERDGEFIEPKSPDREGLIQMWEEGWGCMEKALAALRPEDLLHEVIIRSQSLTALDAVNRQLSHYAYHVGQIVHIARERCGKNWRTLSIARGKSGSYPSSDKN